MAFEYCAGIMVSGENHFELAPQPSYMLEFAGATYLSCRGQGESRWENADGTTKFSFTVPANTTATINLPNGKTQTVAAGVYEYTV